VNTEPSPGPDANRIRISECMPRTRLFDKPEIALTVRLCWLCVRPIFTIKGGAMAVFRQMTSMPDRFDIKGNEIEGTSLVRSATLIF